MSPEVVVTREMIEGASDEVKFYTGGRYNGGERELSWLVYETLTSQLGLPWKRVKGMNMPDEGDPRVKELREKLNEFDFTARRTEHLGKLRGPFSEITYAETLPDPDTILGIADSSSKGTPFLSAILVDGGGDTDVVFTSVQATPALQAVLQREGQDFKVVDSAEIWLSESGKIMWIHLMNPWGEDNETQRQNINMLLGKINPKLFQKTQFAGKYNTSIALSEGPTLFWYDPAERSLLAKADKSQESVPQLY